MVNNLVEINKTEVMSVFTKRESITVILERIEYKATGFERDVTTEAGRKAIISMAYRVAQSKTYIESHGKELAAELKALPKIIDSNRKFAKDFLDDLKAKVREPLTIWEAEQDQIKLQKKILIDHEISLLDNLEWDVKRKEEQARIEKERLDYEAKVLADAKVKAKIVADERVREEKIKHAAIELEARANALRLEKNARLDIERAKQQAVADERRRQRGIEDDKKIRAGQIEIEKNRKENVDKVNASIIQDFMTVGLNEKQARYIITVIRDEKIRFIQIN